MLIGIGTSTDGKKGYTSEEKVTDIVARGDYSVGDRETDIGGKIEEERKEVVNSRGIIYGTRIGESKDR